VLSKLPGAATDTEVTESETPGGAPTASASKLEGILRGRARPATPTQNAGAGK
jgi:hypothetical protein